MKALVLFSPLHFSLLSLIWMGRLASTWSLPLVALETTSKKPESFFPGYVQKIKSS